MDAPHGLAVVGPGLIGTSVALAAKRRWPDLDVRTIDHADPLETIGDARCVVLASPVDAIIATLPRLNAVIASDALVLDTGSTKRTIMIAAAMSGLRAFVGGHPMAGGTTSGPAAARPDLFDGRTWFLTNPEAPRAVARAEAFVAALGAVPVVLADRGEEHDRLMAAISHLPQVAASVLMTGVTRAVGTSNLQWAGAGLRDTTRLADSRADIWTSVLASNSAEIAPVLKYYASELIKIADRLEDTDAVRRLFDEASRAKSHCR